MRPWGQSIRLALGKVSAVLPPDLQDQVNRLQRAMLVRGRPGTRGPVPLGRLQKGMAEGRVMRLHYQDGKREAADWREVEPLRLVYYLDHWHHRLVPAAGRCQGFPGGPGCWIANCWRRRWLPAAGLTWRIIRRNG